MLLLDIGNTHSRIARAEGEKITVLRIVRTRDLAPGLLPAREGEEIWGASTSASKTVSASRSPDTCICRRVLMR